MLNPPAKQVIGNNGFRRGSELVGNKDVIGVIIILIPLAKNNDKLDGNITIFQFCLKWVCFMWDFTSIRRFVFHIFDFMPIMLFDEGNELIWFYKTPCFLLRMVHEDSANTDIADFFSFEWATVLPFSALSILRIGFGTSGVIYGKNPIFCGGSGSLVLNDF